jgi:hypothetical protein
MNKEQFKNLSLDDMAERLFKNAMKNDQLPLFLQHDVYLGAVYISSCRTREQAMKAIETLQEAIGRRKAFYAMMMSNLKMVMDLAEKSPEFINFSEEQQRAREKAH